ncbi:MAG: NADP-dependent oxidoreductase [Candidatus Doudnabacteria bacterium]|nr:NADP-dependent oxidoreductase [Candidatus Doudnabacteria bacterium]
MRAVQINQYGGTEVIKVNQDIPKPSVQPGQVLVEVHAVSLNRIDSFLRSGYLQQMMPMQLPLTLAGDFAGTISEVGEGVTDFKVGDEAYGQAGVYQGGSGSLAEFTVAASGKVAKKPTTVGMNEAASLPLVGASAIQGLEEHIQTKTGQNILIHGGAGGIGSLAIQLAKFHGAYVAATVADSEADFAKSLGANQVIDYTTQDFTKVLKDFDAVFDLVGGETATKSFKVLKKGGVLVSMAGQPDQQLAKEHEVTAIAQMTQTSTRQLIRLAELVDSGKIKPQVDKVFAFTEAKEAFDYFEQEHPKGKVGLKLKF